MALVIYVQPSERSEHPNNMKPAKEQQLESNVVEAAIRLRKCVISQGSNKTPFQEAIAAYNDYSHAVQTLVDYRDETTKSN